LNFGVIVGVVVIGVGGGSQILSCGLLFILLCCVVSLYCLVCVHCLLEADIFCHSLGQCENNKAIKRQRK